MLINMANSISKPSIRKHSSSENLFADHLHHHHILQLQEKQSLGVPPPPALVPPSPSRKVHSKLYACIGFIFFFFITIAAFLHSSYLDDAPLVQRTAISGGPIEPKSDESVVRLGKMKEMSALKGLGTVYRMGTKAMNEIVVAHITENTPMQDFRVFLRTLHRSGVPAHADIVFLFAWSALPPAMVDILHEENQHLHSILLLLSNDDGASEVNNSSLSSSLPSSTLPYSPSHGGRLSSNASISPFNINAYKKAGSEKELSAQIFWGSHATNASRTNRTDGLVQFGWGSIVGFDVSELNSDDTLQGFFDHPPLMLRRWACYQMLLGMIRHRFKHVLLTTVNGVVILGDPFAQSRRKVGLYVSMEDRTWGGTASNADELGVLAGLLSTTSDSHKAGTATITLHDHAALPTRRSNAGRKRASRRASGGGLYERVYGKRMWSSLEEFEKRKKLANSGAIVGGIQQIRGLANTMVTEIVKVALERAPSRDAFPDGVLLSYLLHKSSSVLGRRVLEHLHLMDNSESFVHCLIGSQQHSFFLKTRTRQAYPMIHGNSKSKRWNGIVQMVYRDVCASPVEAMVYKDCTHIHMRLYT